MQKKFQPIVALNPSHVQSRHMAYVWEPHTNWNGIPFCILLYLNISDFSWFKVVLILYIAHLYEIKTHQNFSLRHFIANKNFLIYCNYICSYTYNRAIRQIKFSIYIYMYNYYGETISYT